MIFETRKPYVTCRTAQGKTVKLTVSKDAFGIGSDPSCDLHIDAPEIAGKHCQILRMGDSWVVRVEGLNRVLVDNELLSNRDRTLTSGDVINIAGLVDVEFIDPEEIRQKKKAAANAKKAEKDETEAPSSHSRNKLIIVAGAVLWIFVGFLFLKGDRKPQALDFSSVNEQTIIAAVEDLPSCLESAAARYKSDINNADFDLRSEFALLLKSASLSPDDQDVQAFQKTVGAWLNEGMRAETQNNPKAAREAYTQVRRLVPDISCKAHHLAAARLAAVKK
jgi:pSer/pThr/pTyr-binding forkhead associated (FHA) protein